MFSQAYGALEYIWFWSSDFYDFISDVIHELCYQKKGVDFYKGSPLKNQNFEEGTKKLAQSLIFMNLGPQMAKIRVNNQKGVHF